MNFNSHVKSDKAKWIVTAIVLVLIFAILGGLCYSVISGIAPQDWFKQEESSDTPVTDGDGNEMTADVNPMPETLIFSTAHDAMFGSTSGYTVTVNATVGELYREHNGIKWTVEWKNANSTWAKGKSVADYITIVSKYADDTGCNSICTVTCSQSFGETVVLKAQLVNHPYIPAAQCNIEFRQRVVGYDIEFYEGAFLPVDVFNKSASDAVTKTASIVSNASGKDMYLFDYLGVNNTTPDSIYSYDAINAYIVPVFCDYTIEDTTIKTTSSGGATNRFLNAVGISSTLYQIDEFSFVQSPFVNSSGKVTYACGDFGELMHSQIMTLNSEYAYLTGVKSCMDNNEGIWRYTITSQGDYSKFTYTFDVSYTKDTYENVYWTLEAPNAISLTNTVAI